MTSKEPYPSPPASPAQAKADPILRNTLRYTISAKEYKTLHQWLISRSPPAVRKRAPPPSKVASLVQVNDDYNGATIRASLRVLILTQTSLKLWESIKTNLIQKGKPQKSETGNSNLGPSLIYIAGLKRNPPSSYPPTSASPSPYPSSSFSIDSSFASSPVFAQISSPETPLPSGGGTRAFPDLSHLDWHQRLEQV